MIHLGQPEAVHAVVRSFPEARWVVVELWCPADDAETRLRKRGDSDLAQRMVAWHNTARLDTADLRIDTALVFPEFVASMIDSKGSCLIEVRAWFRLLGWLLAVAIDAEQYPILPRGLGSENVDIDPGFLGKCLVIASEGN